MKRKCNRQRRVPVFAAGLIWTAVLGLAIFCLNARAEWTAQTEYRVYFVDADDYDRMIFGTQSGSVPEGTSLSVTYPDQLIGNDGYVWTAVLKSPQSFAVYQAGTHKYYIEYRRDRKLSEPEDPDASGKEKLDGWLEKAWKADCGITGQDPEGLRDPYLVVVDDAENNRRIKNLVSAVGDAEWHYFYMIGKDYTPQTLVIGSSFDAAYSQVMEDTFQVGKSRYQVIRIGVQRKWQPETCSHIWELLTRVPAVCLGRGQETWRCARCRSQETVFLPAPGHTDGDEDFLCDRCGQPVTGEPAAPARWTKGDIQMRKIGKDTYRFRCVDGDYSDGKDSHRKAALFLCDSVIPADIDKTGTELRTFSFGPDNNYKTSDIRSRLQKNSADSSFNLEPISIGVNTAYTGSTEAGAWEQLSENRLVRHDIGFQFMQDKLFCLSVEEALKYRDKLWRFGSAENNPETQLKQYAEGYYLRTPCFAQDETGKFRYTDDVYAVDLVNGNLHTVKTGSETYGLRPAFTLPQE